MSGAVVARRVLHDRRLRRNSHSAYDAAEHATAPDHRAAPCDSVDDQYEWRDDSGHYYRSYGNENWEFSETGLMRRREASINDVLIRPEDRLFTWGEGPRPVDFPGLTELGL